MYALALATDYDGTLAENGIVSDATRAALERLKETGRKLIMVTGRELADLESVFPELGIFDKVVAENGALVYTPASKEERILAPAPPAEFVDRLMMRKIAPLSIGRSVVATREPNETIVLEVIKDLGLELEIIFNKGAVMVLPSGVNKATGLAAALEDLELSAHNVVGIGDAENDHAFLRAVGFGVAVANALPKVRETAGHVTNGARGAGVRELIEGLISHDAALLDTARQRIKIGADDGSGAVMHLSPRGGGVLLAGTSGIGKSTLATALTERFVEQGFQFCVLDPEGDYEDLEDVLVVGDAKSPPSSREIFDLLSKPSNNVAVNMLGIKTAERPNAFAKLLPELAALRARTGRPHWLIIDEAHHLLPHARDGTSFALPKSFSATILVTVHPDLVSRDVLAGVDTVLALGPEADKVIESFCAAIGEGVPQGVVPPPENKVLYWNRSTAGPARPISIERPRQERKRHIRKYAEGDLGDNSFYFRGADGRLNLKAQNLMMFLHIAEGIDDRTWEHHLRAGDYSAWFRDQVKDQGLAEEAAVIEDDDSLDPHRSRAAIAEAVHRRYTAPAD
ncbi:HAD family hydrolase [Mesorhizobium temperatum]|uniref:Phosphoglycolate phosphatase n=2 Tax=Mesorhizobium TaxID=68287 RepID=A0A271LA84_9HYPH|nr:HAD family hydrolase [Mesorhizobium temperatum]PAQ05031.1 phosphoglycolate phosphatase [Mesorhizobium temperatum]